MATFSPRPHDALATDAPRQPSFTGARLRLQQRCYGTLAHELGNISSPIALIADVIESGRLTQGASAAGTLRLVATSLARATTVCRLLRGSTAPGALSPETIADTTAWWTLCAPFAEDMLPDGAAIDASVARAVLPMAQYEALIWATVAIARYACESRPAMRTLVLEAKSGECGAGFETRMSVAAPRTAEMHSKTRQLLMLASWEVRRAGGRLTTADTDVRLDCRVMLP